METHLKQKKDENLRYLLYIQLDVIFWVFWVDIWWILPLIIVQQKREYQDISKASIDFGLNCEMGEKNLNIHGYSDSDLSGDMEDRKSTMGQVLFLVWSWIYNHYFSHV